MAALSVDFYQSSEPRSSFVPFTAVLDTKSIRVRLCLVLQLSPVHKGQATNVKSLKNPY